ncbi:DNA-binding beta-propeller fold protein YncE [Bacillus sp. SORGH_AS 510]|uniref:hypothetical protein n=1 Tax=Bacillus sp. SORGH_AS_0510 TaxID=3041771 RepID=UPI00277F0B4E|nr:hypothetical protein [Bacillus sp. SORGH_AS_0510]MDQ1146580.1 DNA-binding beta-propeller fold protein YncE [Bacillus sp. SORGH_AS_0510]
MGNILSKGLLWAYDFAASGAASMRVWDLKTDTVISTFVPGNGTYGNGRGVAFDPSDGFIWTTRVTGVGGFGDGFIHKNNPLTGEEILTIPDPGGVNGPGIGALDMDPDDCTLWAAVYLPILKNDPETEQQVLVSRFYNLNPRNGKVIKIIEIPFQGDPSIDGNDTLAIARPSDLGGKKVILSDAGEIRNQLFAVDVNTGMILKTYTLPVGVAGIDEDENTGDLIVTDVFSNFYNLGPAPYNTIIGILDNLSHSVEDISLNQPRKCKNKGHASSGSHGSSGSHSDDSSGSHGSSGKRNRKRKSKKG